MVNSQYFFGDDNYGIEFYQRHRKNISNLLVFKARIKEKLLSSDNKFDYF